MSRGSTPSPDPIDAMHWPAGPGLSRRQLLGLLLATGLLAALPRAASAVTPTGEPLLDILPNRSAAATLGRAYLSAHPEEADAGRLRGLLAATLPADRSDAALICDRVRSQLRADYIRGDLAEVDGWLLSRTEARLYALAALVEPSGAS